MPSFLPDFELPSDPTKIVRLREATVADAIDFSEVDPQCEEEATTLFFERLQAKEKYSDPKRWTTEDRRFALFMYHLHTTKFPDTPLTYVCDLCSAAQGKEVQHTVSVKLADIADGYTPMKGKPVRDVVHEGHAVLVHPVYGADAELMEKVRMGILEEEKTTKKRARKKRSQLALLRILSSLDVPGLDPEVSEEERRPEVEKFILDMGTEEFKEFSGKVMEAIADMRHGLRSTFKDGRVLLETPPVWCDEGRDKEGPGIRLQFPFRAFDYIPNL